LEYGQQQPNNYPLSIAKAIQFIEKNYKDDISLDDIVEVTDLSKYHFTREFKKYMNEDRKSTRLNSSHVSISYAVFCLKKKTLHYPYLFSYIIHNRSLYSFPTRRSSDL